MLLVLFSYCPAVWPVCNDLVISECDGYLYCFDSVRYSNNSQKFTFDQPILILSKPSKIDRLNKISVLTVNWWHELWRYKMM